MGTVLRLGGFLGDSIGQWPRLRKPGIRVDIGPGVDVDAVIEHNAIDDDCIAVASVESHATAVGHSGGNDSGPFSGVDVDDAQGVIVGQADEDFFLLRICSTAHKSQLCLLAKDRHFLADTELGA